MGRVSGKVAIVTGSASGMGKADAITLAREGANVMITDLNEEAGRQVAAEIGEAARFMKHDVSNEENWKAVIAETLKVFSQLDILVNNAGVMKIGTIEDTTLEDWQFINRINSDGVFLGCKHAIPAMEKSGGGSIINMSSISAMQGMPFIAAYSASKGAVRGLTKHVAVYCKVKKNNIRCNSIHPDGVNTPMIVKVATGKDTATQEEIDSLDTPDYPMAEPQDIADMVLFLASDESRFVTGAEMMIDNAAMITPKSA